MKLHRWDYEKIYEHFGKLTDNFSEDEITPHHATAQVLLDLCRGERKWEFLTEEERKKLTKNGLIQNLRELGQCLKAVLTKKLISYIRKRKVTLAPYNKIPFQQVQNQVSDLVADHNPAWFQSHKEVFEKMTDGMFGMEYGRMEVNNQKFLLGEFPHYEGYNYL